MKSGSERPESQTLILIKDPNDERITAIGKRLRKWSIDEFPQVENIRRREMSAVGIRPLTVQELAYYSSPELGGEAYYRAYTLGRPGATGEEQTSGRGNLTPLERVEIGMEYVHNATLLGDVDILRKTVQVIYSREGAH